MFKQTRLVINKVTNSCNLHCRYCSADSGRHHPEMMDMDTLCASVDFVLRITGKPRVFWLFHGGEPLLLGWQWLRDAIAYARSRAQIQGIRIDFGLVTNGTLLNADSAHMLRDEDVVVSVSLDGPPSINDIYRAESTQVLAGIDLMRSIGVRFRILGLIHPANWNRIEQVIAFLLEEGLCHTKFNLCFQVGRGFSVPKLSPQQAFAARKGLLDVMIKYPDRFVEANVLYQVLKYFDACTLPYGAGCTTIHCGAANGFLGIRYDGAVFPCGRADDLGDAWKLMDVWNEPDQKAVLLRVSAYHACAGRASCYTCRAAKVCDYHCPAYQIASPDNRVLQCGVSHLMLEYLDALSAEDKERIPMVFRGTHKALPDGLQI